MSGGQARGNIVFCIDALRPEMECTDVQSFATARAWIWYKVLPGHKTSMKSTTIAQLAHTSDVTIHCISILDE